MRRRLRGHKPIVRTPVRWPVLLPAAQAPSGSDTTATGLAGWAPEGDYWKVCRTVFMVRAYDSNRRVTETELPCSYASPEVLMDPGHG